jgi:hypothetical protein
VGTRPAGTGCEPAVEAEPAKERRERAQNNRDYDIIVLDGAAGT